LQQVDPRSAARLKPGDSQRIQRALEVFELAGTPLSALLEAASASPTPLRTIAWMPSDRATLHQRIEARFDSMLAAGFLDEVRGLRDRGDLDPGLPSMRSVGYRRPGITWKAQPRSTSSAPPPSRPAASWPSGR